MTNYLREARPLIVVACLIILSVALVISGHRQGDANAAAAATATALAPTSTASAVSVTATPNAGAAAASSGAKLVAAD